MHISEDILNEDSRIDPHKIDLVGRMAGKFYSRASGDAIFTVETPGSSERATRGKARFLQIGDRHRGSVARPRTSGSVLPAALFHGTRSIFLTDILPSLSVAESMQSIQEVILRGSSSLSFRAL